MPSAWAICSGWTPCSIWRTARMRSCSRVLWSSLRPSLSRMRESNQITTTKSTYLRSAWYEVHRSATPNFTPNPTTLLTTIRDQSVTRYRDTTAAPDKPFTYVVVTNGSRSFPQTVTLPASTQARKLLQPEPAAGQDTSLIYVGVSSVDCGNNGADSNVYAGSHGSDLMR